MTRSSNTTKTNTGPAIEAWSLLSDLVLDNERKRRLADSIKLSFGRARALRRIVKYGPKSIRELADLIGIDAPYLTLVVDDLENQGFVERLPHPSDRRSKLVKATPFGEMTARHADEILGTPPEGLATLSHADLVELLRILRQIATHEEV